MKKYQALQEGDCIHGLRRFQCATCYHPEGTCGYGHCQHKATHKLASTHEIRSLCHKHAMFLFHEGRLFQHSVSNAQIWKGMMVK